MSGVAGKSGRKRIPLPPEAAGVVNPERWTSLEGVAQEAARLGAAVAANEIDPRSADSVSRTLSIAARSLAARADRELLSELRALYEQAQTLQRDAWQRAAARRSGKTPTKGE